MPCETLDLDGLHVTLCRVDLPSYAADYDADYYAHGCGTPYARDAAWLGFFARVADRLVEAVGPARVLDVGCAMGFLVEALRRRGVEAWGVDVSAYAIAQVDRAVAPFCRVGAIGAALPADWPERFDLVTCIEVLEHLPPAEAPAAIAWLCGLADDILFSSTPLDHAEPTHLNVQPVDYWAGLFAQAGFYRDLDFEARFLTPWALRLRRGRALPGAAPLVRGYERRLLRLGDEIEGRRTVAAELRAQVADLERQLQAARERAEALDAAQNQADVELMVLRRERDNLADQLAAWRGRWLGLEASPGYGVLWHLQQARARFLPPGSRRERAFGSLLGWRRIQREAGLGFLLGHLAREGRLQAGHRWRERRRRRSGELRRLTVAAVLPPAPLTAHQEAVDIVVCVHDALADLQRCLASVLAHTRPPYRLILVDDGSGPQTAGWLRAFAAGQGEDCLLLRSEEATGYTFAANRGLGAGDAPWVLLLNSDTEVTEGWLDRLLDCGRSDPRIGLVGPLSNAATYQSIPEQREGDDWAINDLPTGFDLAAWAGLVAADSARLRPRLPFLNGFCLLLRRAMLEAVGPLDEATFGAGYGEENDLALRARAAGWDLALADDAFVFHAQSRSYSHERRRQLEARAGAALVARHGVAAVAAGEAVLREDPVLEGIRARSRHLADRARILAGGRERFGGRRLLCVMPLAAAGGGASIAMFLLRAMRAMGVEVAVFNLGVHREAFEAAYPALDLPVVYGQPEDLLRLAGEWDGLLATMYSTVDWLAAAARGPAGRHPVYGYFVQDLEAYFYRPGSERFHAALKSYQQMPELRICTMTPWNAAELGRLFGLEVPAVMPAYDADLFRPRPRALAWPARPLRILGMIRPETPFRGPRLTMEVFQEISRRHGPKVEFVLFGVEEHDAGWKDLPRDFPFLMAGRLSPQQVAELMNQVDVFCDFSTWQAMGMTAMEAMLCGCAVVVTRHGGPGVYARDGANALLVDPEDKAACIAAVDRLVRDPALRGRLARQALVDLPLFYPERAAWNLLNRLFGPEIDAAMAAAAAEAAAREAEDAA